MPQFTGEESRKFEALPEGDYELTISRINEESCSERTKNPGAAMWRITYDVGETNRKVFDNIVFVKSSFWRISNWWRALGYEVVPGQSIDTGETTDHIGKSLKAHLTIREFNGDKQNDVAYFIEPAPADGRAVMVPPQKKDEPDDIPF